MPGNEIYRLLHACSKRVQLSQKSGWCILGIESRGSAFATRGCGGTKKRVLPHSPGKTARLLNLGDRDHLDLHRPGCPHLLALGRSCFFIVGYDDVCPLCSSFAFQDILEGDFVSSFVHGGLFISLSQRYDL